MSRTSLPCSQVWLLSAQMAPRSTPPSTRPVKVDCARAVAPPGLGRGSLSLDLAWGLVNQT